MQHWRLNTGIAVSSTSCAVGRQLSLCSRAFQTQESGSGFHTLFTHFPSAVRESRLVGKSEALGGHNDPGDIWQATLHLVLRICKRFFVTLEDGAIAPMNASNVRPSRAPPPLPFPSSCLGLESPAVGPAVQTGKRSFSTSAAQQPRNRRAGVVLQANGEPTGVARRAGRHCVAVH